MNIENESLKFYYVGEKYASFLRDKKYGDACVPYTEYPKRRKFFIGIVFQIGEFDYFAPISSNREINPASFNIKKLERRALMYGKR